MNPYQILPGGKRAELPIPEPDAETPLPIVLAKDGAVILSYQSYVARKDICVIVSFPLCYAHRFGKGETAWEPGDFGGRGKRFVFSFKDAEFECVAEDYGSEVSNEADDVVKLMAKRIYK